MGDDAKKRLDPLTSLVLSLAIAGNGFFIKRLVEEVDRTKQYIIRQQETIEDLQDQIGRIHSRLRIVIKEIPLRRKKHPLE